MKAYETELQPSLEEIDQLALRFESAEEVEAVIRSQGAVDRSLMQRLESIEPEAISSLFPIASYTQESSQQNLGVSLESTKAAQFIIALAMLGALSGALYLLVQMFQKDDLGKKQEKYDRARNAYKDNQRKLQHKQQDVTDPDKIESVLFEQFLNRFEKNESLVRDYIEAHRPGGVVLDTVTKLQQRIENRIEDLDHKLYVLGQIIDKMYERDGAIVKETKQSAQKLLDDLESNQFVQQMQNVQQHIDQFAQDGASHDAFMRNDVIQDRNFASFALQLDDRELDIELFQSIDRPKQVDKWIEQIQEKVKEMEHQRKADAGEKYIRKNVKRRKDAQGNSVAVLPELQMDEGLEKLMKEIEMRVRYEIDALTQHRRVVSHLLDFHVAIMQTRLNYQQFLDEQLGE